MGAGNGNWERELGTGTGNGNWEWEQGMGTPRIPSPNPIPQISSPNPVPQSRPLKKYLQTLLFFLPLQNYKLAL